MMQVAPGHFTQSLHMIYVHNGIAIVSMCAKADKHSDLRHYSKYLFGPDQSHPRPSRPPWAAQARTQNRAEVSQSLSLLRQLPDQLLLLAQLLCWQLLHLPYQQLLADICFSVIGGV